MIIKRIMKQKITYKRNKILLTFSIPIIILLLMLTVFVFVIYEQTSFSFEYPIAFGAYAVLFVVLIFLVFIVIKVVDMILMNIETDENGLYYKSLFKNVFIPWHEVLQVKRIHLFSISGGGTFTALKEYNNPKRPEDIFIRTRSHGTFIILHSLIEGNEGNRLDLFVQEVENHTKWDDTEKDWKKHLFSKRAISMKIMGIGMFLIGIYFQVSNPSSKYEILQQVKDSTGIHWVTIFCFIFGIYLLIAKPKKP